MMSVESIMFSLIRSEICGTLLDDTIKSEISADMRKSLYSLSNKHDVAHIVASALDKVEHFDDDVSKAFKKKLMVAVYRDSQRQYAIEQLVSVLESANIPHILLKGSVIRKYYPSTWMRTSCDVDVLIKEEYTDIAIKSLCEVGYTRIADCSTHDYNMISANNVHIELHYTLSQDGEFSNTDELLNGIWDNVVPIEKHRFSYHMSSEMFFVYHLVHMGRHLLHGGCGIRPFIDLWLLEKQMSYDKDKLQAMLSKAGLLDLFKVASALGKVWMEMDEHTEETGILQEYILNGGVYGTTENSAQIKAARGVSKTKSFLNLMFLSKETLEVMYPNLKKYPILFPFYQMKRWFRVSNRRKRQKIKHLINTRNTVSQTDMESTKIMLEHLGLLNQQE